MNLAVFANFCLWDDLVIERVSGVELIEIQEKLGLAKRLGIKSGWLYTLNGDSPGIAETLAECDGRIVLGEIGKTTAEEMAKRLYEIRF